MYGSTAGIWSSRPSRPDVHRPLWEPAPTEDGDRTTPLGYDAPLTEFSRQTQTMETPIDTPRLPRKRRSLAQELVTVLTEQIRDGLLKRGDKLPTESAIMEAHGVSRTVVREAIS